MKFYSFITETGESSIMHRRVLLATGNAFCKRRDVLRVVLFINGGWK